jgi:hypothetical protein
MILNEIKTKAEVFKKEETFTFIQESVTDDKTFAYNGFITKIDKDFLLFYDVIIDREFPIVFSKILTIELSRRKEVTPEEAKMKFKFWDSEKKHGI